MKAVLEYSMKSNRVLLLVVTRLNAAVFDVVFSVRLDWLVGWFATQRRVPQSMDGAMVLLRLRVLALPRTPLECPETKTYTRRKALTHAHAHAHAQTHLRPT
jgi:hypothetical protein